MSERLDEHKNLADLGLLSTASCTFAMASCGPEPEMLIFGQRWLRMTHGFHRSRSQVFGTCGLKSRQEPQSGEEVHDAQHQGSSECARSSQSTDRQSLKL
jgi:hypothetical protein